MGERTDEGGWREELPGGVASKCGDSLDRKKLTREFWEGHLWQSNRNLYSLVRTLKPSESPGRPDRDLQLFRIQGVSNHWDHDDNSCRGRCWAVSLQISFPLQTVSGCLLQVPSPSSLGRPFPSSPTLMSDPGQSIHATTWALASPKSCCPGSHGKGSGLELRRDPKREGEGL